MTGDTFCHDRKALAELIDKAINIERLIHQRSKARRMGEWDKADRLRNELAEQGIELEDVGENTSWRFR